MITFGVDIGSTRRPGGFAWAALHEDGTFVAGANDPSKAAEHVVACLSQNEPVALAFECPLSVPVPNLDGNTWAELGRGRADEGNRPWSAGAGAGAMATGLVQIAWILDYVQANAGAVSTTTQMDPFHAEKARLFLAEAFVSGDGKPVAVTGSQDEADARAAATRLRENLDDGSSATSDVRCAPHGAFNLAAAIALRAGLQIDPAELSSDVLVAKVAPPVRAQG